METVSLRDSIPEVVLWNAHDGSGAYQLATRMHKGWVCLEPDLSFPSEGVSVESGTSLIAGRHRGGGRSTSALEMSERFGVLAGQVDRMEHRLLNNPGMSRSAHAGAGVGDSRLPGTSLPRAGFQPEQLLTCRRVEDLEERPAGPASIQIQENLLRGGLSRRTASGRRTRTRAITSIAEDVRINGRVWELAEEVLAD